MPLHESQIKHLTEQTGKANGYWRASYQQKDDAAKNANTSTAKGICLALSIHFLGHAATGRFERFLALLDVISGEVRVALCAEIMEKEARIAERATRYATKEGSKYKGMLPGVIGAALTLKLRRYYFRELYSISWDKVARVPPSVSKFDTFGISVVQEISHGGAGYYLIDISPSQGLYGHSIAIYAASTAPLSLVVFDANIGVFQFGAQCDWNKFHKWLAYFFLIAGYDPYYCPCKVPIEKYVAGKGFKTAPISLTIDKPALRHPAGPRQGDFYKDDLNHDPSDRQQYPTPPIPHQNDFYDDLLDNDGL